MTRSRLVAIAIAAAVCLLALPLANLVFAPKTAGALSPPSPGVPDWDKAAPILEKKCAHCHVEGVPRPFYAHFPGMKQVMEKDIEDGLTFLDLTPALHFDGAAPVSEADIAKIKFAVMTGDMPPKKYLALHWNHRLTAEDRAVLVGWIHALRTKYFASESAAPAHREGAIQPLPEPRGLHPAKVALGAKLFGDKRLSKDGSIACASCHGLDKGGTDQKRFAEGIGKQLGNINSPTVFNSGLQYRQFWDGRAADLFAQADGPVNNPVEMGSNWPEVIGKLSEDAALASEAAAVYPGGLTGDNIRNAIAEFEKSLITPGRLDDFLKGDDRALTAGEKSGFDLFVKKGCAMCHVGSALGGQSFEKIGIFKDYLAARGNPSKADLGRIQVTKRPRDRYKLKVPMLRNVALTHPYFHDGTVQSLDRAVDLMASYELDLRLSEKETNDIVAFLRALTGRYREKPL